MSKSITEREAASKVNQLVGRPTRDPRVEASAHNNKLWTLVMFQNVFGFAGDDPNPRPLPKRTLYTIKKKMSDYLQAGVEQRVQADPDTKIPWAWDTIHLAFCSDRVKMPLDEAIPVPREDLWWLAAPDDLVLLSDRVTHHYTTVDHVVREADRIFFIDEWPDRIFLKQGLNEAGVAAEVHPYMAGVLEAVAPALRGKKHVSITRDEFSRVIVGLITLDTRELLDHYLAHRPHTKGSFAVRFSFGATLMDAELDRLVKFAVSHFKAAWRIATANPDAGDTKLAAARYYQSLVISNFVQQYSGDVLAAKPFADELRSLLGNQTEESLLESLKVEEIARIGNAAGHAQDFESAVRYLDRAVARGPTHEGARHLRAMAKSRIADWPGTIEDIKAALAANAERTLARQSEHDARDSRDRYGLSDDEARLEGLRSRRMEELSLLVTALVQLQRWPEARAAAEETISLDPDQPNGYRMLGALAAQADQVVEAQRYFTAARAREKSERGRVQLDQALAALAATPRGGQR